MSSTTMTVGYVLGGAFVVGEIISACAVTFYHEKMSKRFPRLTSHLSIGVKTSSYRLCASIDTFLIALLVTGNPYAGMGIVGFEVLSKFALYYSHEWVWARPFLAKLLIERHKVHKLVEA